MRLRLLIATFVTAVPVLAGCPSNQPAGTVGASPSPGANTPNSVTITQFQYSPPTLTVTAGTTVTWINADVARHTATSDDQSFDTGDLPPGRNFPKVFSAAGTYPYHCNFHPTEKGTIVVR
jgi:plastocyanin